MEQETPKTHTALFQALRTLSIKAIDMTIEYRDNGKLEVIPYQFLPVEEIDYLMETYHYDWDKIEYYDFYEWRSEDFVNFMDGQLKTLKEFDHATQLVVEEFNIPDWAVVGGLTSLLRLIIKEAPNGQITLENIDYYVQLFIDGYEFNRTNKPVVWNVELWLGNIYIESDEIEIEQGVFLRRPTKEQLADVKPKPTYIDEFSRMTGRGLFAGAILSFSVAANKESAMGLYPEQVSEEIEQWLNVFRLLKPTDLTIVYQSIDPVSLFEYSSSENKERPQDKIWKGKVEQRETSSYKLYLKAEEEEIFRTFVKNAWPALKEISRKTYLSGSSYDLAFHRYNDALLKSEVNAYKILSSITSLESLLSDGSTEITFRIRMRIAKLLSFFGFDPLDVSAKVKAAYTLRSKLVHGSKPSGNGDLLKFARNHTHEILNYNRICLLIGLQLKNLAGKQELIDRLDDSLIDAASDSALKKLIEESVKIPIINPFPKREDPVTAD